MEPQRTVLHESAQKNGEKQIIKYKTHNNFSHILQSKFAFISEGQ